MLELNHLGCRLVAETYLADAQRYLIYDILVIRGLIILEHFQFQMKSNFVVFYIII